jgi:hypothetical protein
MLHRIVAAEVCDATSVERSNDAGYIILLRRKNLLKIKIPLLSGIWFWVHRFGFPSLVS